MNRFDFISGLKRVDWKVALLEVGDRVRIKPELIDATLSIKSKEQLLASRGTITWIVENKMAIIWDGELLPDEFGNAAQYLEKV